MAKKKAGKAKKTSAKTKKRVQKPSLAAISKKLDVLIEGQETIKKEEKNLETEENQIGQSERKELANEKGLEAVEAREISELEKLEHLEEEVKRDVAPHPLKKITSKDLARGAIGALFGAVAHYTFIYGLEVAASITMARAAVLFFLSFLIGGLFLYATGFRKIKDPKVLAFLPIRLLVLYFTAVAMSVIVLWFFEPGFTHSFEGAFRSTATVTLIAVIGACTADVIGKN